MTAIGETLRRERLRRNLDLQQISRETKINMKMLEAIEAEQFDKLPGGVFARSFVRQYARALGLDEDEFGAEVRQMFEAAPPPEEAQPLPEIAVPRLPDWRGTGHAPAGSSWLPAFAMVILVMLVCSGIYVWWQNSRAVRTAPSATQAAAPAKAPVTPAPKSETSQPPAETLGFESKPQPATVQQALQSTPLPPSPSAEGSAARLTTGALEQVGSGPMQVALRAEEDTWVSAKLDGKQSYSGTIKPNETKLLNATGQVRLLIGNAGGLSISLNGRPLPPVGPRGQVRVVDLTPGGVQVVPRNPVPDSL